MHNNKNTLRALLLLAGMGLSGLALAHGDVVPQAVNTEGLEPLGKEWRETNPYRAPYEKNALAVEIGASAYNQNCARCHGLEAKSGGIAPDLRYLETDASGDEWFKERVINGAVRDGAVYMPKMADFLSQEALWAIRSYLESVHVDE
ncbi:cytochrome c-550 PedF [Pseudomonas otitidis]|uniref:Cytochrome c-550 PedF n=1 Tax=Metapseudomonas otitidis TaxID=319939 RepID=A0ABU3XSE3_9GAMM|nr:cytochrome c-550 PedF [Pseudomonas otitidis]MDV3440850.1 cytochrome c-550 PedF [Pseudomonas otitidis]MEE1893614.1 cytochrome c-550 PedF [Pseudomonas otitidis]WMR32142.1 cytochrome c-550 PedF [Pseudomonas otitidis]